MGYACLIRYVTAVVLLPLALYVIFTGRSRFWEERPLRCFALGFGIFALLILSFNLAYYGGPLTTGYHAPHTLITLPFFDLAYFFGQSPIDPGGYPATLAALWGNFRYLLILVPLSFFVMSRGKAAFLFALGVLFPILFSFYLYAPQGFGSRFLLPSFPALYLLIGQLASRGAALVTRRRSLGTLVLLVLAVLCSLRALPNTLQTINQRNQRESSRVALIQGFTSQTQEDSVFLTWRYHDQVILYGHRSAMHFDMIPSLEATSEERTDEEFERGLAQVVGTLLDAGVPVYWVRDESGHGAGRFEPEPVLRANFRVVPWRERQPTIYRIHLK